MLETNGEALKDVTTAGSSQHTSEILVSAAAILVLVLSVYLTVFDNQSIF